MNIGRRGRPALAGLLAFLLLLGALYALERAGGRADAPGVLAALAVALIAAALAA